MAMPLAQLVDVLPRAGWWVLIVGGLLAPALGLMISSSLRGFDDRRGAWVGGFYLIALPLAGMVFLTGTENPLAVCSFLLLLPIGGLLGVILLVGPVRGQ